MSITSHPSARMMAQDARSRGVASARGRPGPSALDAPGGGGFPPAAFRASRTNVMLLLIDNYDSFTYNLVHYLGELGAPCEVYRNDKISVAEVLALKPKGIVLSPGPCTPNEAGICCELIEKAGPKVPML